MIAFIRAFLTGVLSFWLCFAALAEESVDLELVLAVDISLSMDWEEQQLQRAGYAEAFRDPRVLEAIRSGGYGRIAVAYMEWAGTGTESLIVDWMIVDGPGTAGVFADQLLAAPPNRRRRTSISGGLMAAAALFPRNPSKGLRRVIDISGDGPNNEGLPVNEVRDLLVERGIVINGLPLVLNRGGYSFFDIADLDRYYTDCVIGGFGAFTLPVLDIAKFGEAVRQKLVLEIAADPAPVIPAQGIRATGEDGTTDCLIGEKMWREWRSRGYDSR